ncbi:MAG: SusC/RagA family TonB-linked outer membrane protein [Bacteroidales bacterium]|nr:SusC/RagA family TonB-linked outer membrane protein [Bacteroidales bacterium]
MKKVRIILSMMLLTLATAVFAQNVSVSGTVTDASNGESVPGASVILRGTTTGTVTNLDGMFALTVPSNAALIISSIGYKTVEVPVNGRSTINVALEVDNELLEEVVVTALGISREKKALGYAVQDVKGDALTQAASSSLSSALQGKVSGLQISSSSGMPGASSKIVIRGARSLDGNNQPLYVIDGMPVSSSPDRSTGNSVTGSDYSGRAIDIDPNDIESVNVLKGQAAAALYGMRASNGVIVITTKKGSSTQAGRTSVNFSTNYSYNKVAVLPEINDEYAQGSNGKFNPNTSLAWGPLITDLPKDATYGGDANGHPGMYRVPQREQAGLDGWVTPQAYYNIRDYFKAGHTFGTSASVAHNSGTGSFIISLGNTTETGIIRNTGMKRYNARVGADQKLNPWFTAGFNANYIQSTLSKQTGANDGIVAALYGAPASYDLKGIPCHYEGDPYKQTLFRSLTFNNPYWAPDNNRFTEDTQRFFGNAYIDFKTDFSASAHTLDVKYQIGMDAYTTIYENMFGYNSKGGLGSDSMTTLSKNTFNSLLTANYNWDINEDWNFSALAGNEIVYANSRNLAASGSNFVFKGFNHMNNLSVYSAGAGEGHSLTFGTFAEVSADYRSMLFLNATVRTDYVSSMPHGNRMFTYPSVGLGFIFTELEGLKNDVLTYGKLRASYAEVGQAGTFVEAFYDIPGFGGGFSGGTPAMYPTNSVVAYTPYSVIYDANLRPQNTKSIEGGIDLAFFNGRISLEYTFSRQNVKDQIFGVPMASSTGYGTKVTNAGRVHTNAHELTVSFIPVQTRDFTWDMDFNFTKIDNYVDELAEGVSSIMLGGFVEPQVRAGIGDKYPVIYGNDYLRNDEGKVIVGDNGIPLLGDLAVLGEVSPDFILGFSTGFDWKGLRLNAVLDWKKGGNMYAGTYTMMDYYGTSKRSEDYRKMESFVFDWEPSVKVTARDADGNPTAFAPNDIAIPGSNAQKFFSDMNDISKAFVNDASYLKLREISLSYPVVKANWGTITASAFARNILLWTAIPGFDPEASQGNNNMGGGFERFSLPGTSSYGCGLSLNF